MCQWGGEAGDSFRCGGLELAHSCELQSSEGKLTPASLSLALSCHHLGLYFGHRCFKQGRAWTGEGDLPHLPVPRMHRKLSLVFLNNRCI